MNATREKTRLWLLIFVGVVATLLGQTHAREIFAPSPHESGIFAAQTQASTGENYDACRYDALDSLLAANRVGYHATHADVVPLIQQNGFRAGTAPGRLGSGGTYVNSTPQGAIAEFAHHNPGVTPSVLKVQYHPGINASTSVAPRNYVERLPFHNVDSISAPSVRLPGTTNTNVLNGSLRIIE